MNSTSRLSRGHTNTQILEWAWLLTMSLRCLLRYVVTIDHTVVSRSWSASKKPKPFIQSHIHESREEGKEAVDAAACQICFPHLCRMEGLLFCKSPCFFSPIPICGSDLFHGRVVSTSSSQSRGAIFQVWISTVWSLHAYGFFFFFWPLVSLAFLILFLVRRGTPIGVHQEATGLF